MKPIFEERKQANFFGGEFNDGILVKVYELNLDGTVVFLIEVYTWAGYDDTYSKILIDQSHRPSNAIRKAIRIFDALIAKHPAFGGKVDETDKEVL